MAFQVNLYAVFNEIAIYFLSTILGSRTVFHPAEVKELKSVEALDQNSSSNLRINFPESKPIWDDTFVSMSPGQELHYQSRAEKKNFEIETFEGTIKERRKLNGEKVLTWTTSKPVKQKSNYIPWNERTRTLLDVKDLDTYIAKDTAKKIQNSIEEEQIRFKEEALSGE